MRIFKDFTHRLYLGLFIVISLYSNPSGAQDNLDLRLQPKPSGILYQKNNTYIGSEYLFDDWREGELEFRNGQKLRNLQINYNAFTDDVAYAIERNSAVIVTKYQLSGFNILDKRNERSFILTSSVKASGFNQDKPVYLEILYNGSNKVYVHHALKINKLLVKDNPFNKSVYYPEITYYVAISEEFISSPHKKSSYYNYYDEAVVKEIIHANKLSLKKAEDLILFISALDKIRSDNE